MNGWVRLGIVASVIWMVALPLYWNVEYQSDSVQRASSLYRMCSADPYPGDPAKCRQLMEKSLESSNQFDPGLAGQAVPAALPASHWVDRRLHGVLGRPVGGEGVLPGRTPA